MTCGKEVSFVARASRKAAFPRLRRETTRDICRVQLERGSAHCALRTQERGLILRPVSPFITFPYGTGTERSRANLRFSWLWLIRELSTKSLYVESTAALIILITTSGRGLKINNHCRFNVQEQQTCAQTFRRYLNFNRPVGRSIEDRTHHRSLVGWSIAT